MRILLIEDSKEDAKLIQELLDVLSDNHVIRRADRLSAGLKLLEEYAFDAVLLDLGLPDSVGLEALVRIRDQKPELPIIVLTGLSDEALSVKALSLGAQESLVKGTFNTDSLYRAIRYSIERQGLETERKKLTDAVPALLSYIDANYCYRSVNQAYKLWFGLKQEHIVGRHVREVLGEALWEKVRPYMERALSGERVFYEEELPNDHGGPRWVHVSLTPDSDDHGQVHGFIVLVQDISGSKRAAKERELAVDFLRLVNESSNKKDMIQAAVTFFRQHSGCEAVGIRLHEDGDYPYYEVRGFPVEFVLAENSLCSRSDTGEVIRNGTGNPVLDCMCGNIISGRFDPSKPFFTEVGSFWSNNTTELLASTTEADRQARTRNRCNGEGYESVALIALRVGEDRLGLLQLNDRRKSRFSPEDIALWERLAGYLAVALAKFQAEESLRSSEELYRSLFDNMLNGFAYCRMLFLQDRPQDFTYLAVNDAFTTLTGLQNVVGKKVTEIIPGIRETDPGLFEIYGRVALSGKPERFETYVAALQMWFSIAVYCPKKEHFVAVFDVITERKKIEKKIIDAKKEWEDTFDAITELIFIHDSDRKILRANRAYQQMAGMSPVEFIGRPYYEIFPKSDAPSELCRKSAVSGKPALEEIVIDSIGKTFSVRMYPNFDGEGKYLYSVHVMLDITERKKVLEAEIMKETADAANKAKSDFLAGMSHEFRTPLNAIIGFAELMSTGLGGPLTAQQKEYVRDIFTSGQHLLCLVNDILDLSKVEAGKMELQMNEFNIKTLVETSIALFKEKAFKQSLQITYEIAQGLDTMIGDERKIKQVLFNLLGNAVKFTPYGGRIHVETTLSDDKEFVKYSVSDTGIGISTEDQNKLFKPFQQVDTRLTRKYKGTGLGLSLCKRIVELHGGRIWVESEADKGSNFIFVMPIPPKA